MPGRQRVSVATVAHGSVLAARVAALAQQPTAARRRRAPEHVSGAGRQDAALLRARRRLAAETGQGGTGTLLALALVGIGLGLATAFLTPWTPHQPLPTRYVSLPAAASEHGPPTRSGLAPAAFGGPAPAGLPRRWCGNLGDAAQRVEHVGKTELSGAPTVKVIYARPADVPDHFAAVANDLQAAASDIDLGLAQQAGGRKTLRFDLGTSCGPGYLDLASLMLPKTREEYLHRSTAASIAADIHGEGDDVFRRVRDDLRSLVPRSPGGPRNYLVLVDGLTVPGHSGEADQPADERPGPDNQSNRGGNFAFVFGTDNATPDTMLHEVAHNLGAVGAHAPHEVEPGHCTDGGVDGTAASGVDTDLMCYSERSRHLPPCPWPSADEAYLGVAVDCHRDDYFALPDEVPPGSYLAMHWNLYNSAFLGSCAELAPACGAVPQLLAFARAGMTSPAPPLWLPRDTCRGRCPASIRRLRRLPVVARWDALGTLTLSAPVPRLPRGQSWVLCVHRSSATSARRAALELRWPAGGAGCAAWRGAALSNPVALARQLDDGSARWITANLRIWDDFDRQLASYGVSRPRVVPTRAAAP